jgi:hypothetical protein
MDALLAPSSPTRCVRLGLALTVTLALLAACSSTDDQATRSVDASAATPVPAATGASGPAGSGPLASAPSSAAATVAPTATPGATTARWITAGTMHLTRMSTHALLLGDGRVLVVGDDRYTADRYRDYLNVVDTSAIAELWSPSTGKWRMAEALPKPRGEFAAVTLDDGRALVAGGANQACQSFSSAYVFDPATEHWSKTGLMGTARTNPVAAVLKDGRVLVAGGAYSSNCNDYENVSTPGAVGALAAFRGVAEASAGSDGPRLADVDVGPLGHALATAELFDPATGHWSDTGAMRQARVGAQAVTLGDGRALVWGAQEDWGMLDRGETYDPATGRFSWTEQLPGIDREALRQLGVRLPGGSPEEWVTGGRLVALRNGDALLVGTLWSWGPLDITRTFRFDASRDAWHEDLAPYVERRDPDDWQTITGDYGVPHPDGIVALLPDGRLLIAGGSQQRAAALLHPVTGARSKLPRMPAERSAGLGVVLRDGSVLVVPVAQGYSEAFRFMPTP